MNHAPQRIYLDNAATSWPKPPTVLDSVQNYFAQLGAPAGRGTYPEATEVEQLIRSTRLAVAELLGTTDPNQVVFTLNGTDSLNQAIHGTIRRGDHVVTSLAEHNSVLRPLRQLEMDGQVAVTRVPCDGVGMIDPDEIRAAIQPTTRLICVTHVSNVTGARQPAQRIGDIAAECGIPLLIDAAQSLGHFDVTSELTHASIVAAPGHKGLLGPLGTGILFVRSDFADQIRATRQGGTGTNSESDQQPGQMPEKLEAGNLNVPGIVGLHAGIQYLRDTGFDAIHQRELDLVQQLEQGVREIDRIRTYLPPPASRTGVLSLTLENTDSRDFASLLDSVFRIQVRAGFHCAPTIHGQLGTLKHGGTIRFSVGPFVTGEQIDRTIAAVQELTSEPI